MSEVIIYTKPGCPYCAAAKEDMDGRGEVYIEYDITDGERHRNEALKLAGAAKVPVIVRDGEVQVGFGGS